MNPNQRQYTESIKRRIGQSFPEANGDPVINIFIEACAAEFAEIHDEIDEFKANFIHELSKSFARGLVFGPKPAHALITCLPTGDKLTIPAFSKFVWPVKNSFYSNLKNIVLSSVADHEIFNYHLESHIIDNELFWVLSLHNQDFNFDNLIAEYNLLLFIELKKNQDNDRHKLLKASLTKAKLEVYYQNHAGETFSGLGNLNIADFLNREKDQKKNSGTSANFNAESKPNIHEKHTGSFLKIATTEYLDSCLALYADKFLKLSFEKHEVRTEDKTRVVQLRKKLNMGNSNDPFLHQIFIKVETEMLDKLGIVLSDIEIQTNCFPVFNLETHPLRHPITNNITEPFNLTMPDEESSFFGLYSVIENFPQEGELQEMDIMQRFPQNISLFTSDINRLSYDAADELVNKLIMKYNTEPLAFEKYRDVIDGLKSMLKYKRFKPPVRKSTIVDTHPVYLFYKPEPGHLSGSVEVKYLTTNGQKANGLKMNSFDNLAFTVNSKEGNPLEISLDQCHLVTPTMGGRDELTDSEKGFEFWNVFYSKGSIITLEDVKNYCYYHFGDSIKNISVGKKYVHDDYIPIRGNVLIEVNITIKIPELKDKIREKHFEGEAVLLEYMFNTKSHSALNNFKVNIDFDYFSV